MIVVASWTCLLATFAALVVTRSPGWAIAAGGITGILLATAIVLTEGIE